MSRRLFLAHATLGVAVLAIGCADTTATEQSTTETDVATTVEADSTIPEATTVADTDASATGDTTTPTTGSSTDDPVNAPRWIMPAEEAPHAATWMCWPSSSDIWGDTLPAVQATIRTLATTIAGFEPVKLLARPDQSDRLRVLAADHDVEVIEAPVDDLWARDTLPCFLVAGDVSDAIPLAAARVRFNGWGNKQQHDGDATLAALVAARLGIPLLDPGLVGEGGGLEVDGAGTVIASRSSWVNGNRNPGVSEADIGTRLVALLGADRIVWVDGVVGKDITDGHIDTLARFATTSTIVLDQPSYIEPGETWYDASLATRMSLVASRTRAGEPYAFDVLVQPRTPRGTGNGFLSSYVNYYVCNGAVIAPSFGDDSADAAAATRLAALYPDRRVVQLDIDPIAAGGGGIHCATRQQPSRRV